ncbi:MAG: anion permease [Lentisphaerae bacterium]|nr:MAG: anion permease [Lentisphaerota bacterium]
MFEYIAYFTGLFLGWSVGSNDSANMFGTAVASRMVRFRTAALLITVFVAIGAFLQGESGIHTVGNLGISTHRDLIICTFAAALAMTLMSILKIPMSSSQMMIGAVIGLSIFTGTTKWAPVVKVLICWTINPLGAMFISAGLYVLLARLIRWWHPNVFILDQVLRVGLLLCGCYGAYALGANGVAIVCVPFIGEGELLIGPGHAQWAALLGGISIGIGAITFSKPVMMTVGKGVVPLDGFTAFIAVFALAVTVHVFALLGVPVSTSQSIVGALLGISLVKGFHIINIRVLLRILGWWCTAPFIAALTAICIYSLFRG